MKHIIDYPINGPACNDVTWHMYMYMYQPEA